MTQQKQYESTILLEITLKHWGESNAKSVAETALGSITQYPYCVKGEVAMILDTREIEETVKA